ncbi:hypothetical protein WM2015_1177 [Wenzhouxiangella marina]|uniref:P/Homo B domain-containing protein n=2 Tax=Wenzhouxiangella marina TaxID=1579979 RepID=A0A0K0XVA4_9GAMM|nr:hypothetical protein WM2015_1177 [Wenzhouxiangella marina]
MRNLMVSSLGAFALAALSSLAVGQTVSFPGAGVGPIPDRGAAGCGPPAGLSLNVVFAASGLVASGNELEGIEVDLDMTHTWVGDVTAELYAPDGVTSHVLFGRVGTTTATGCGDSSNLDGVYTFSTSSFGDLWAAATSVGGADIVPDGLFGTSEPGGSEAGGSFTDMLASFASVGDLNGNWILSVTDQGGGDTGEVRAATLRFIQPPSDLLFDDSFEVLPPP